MTCAALATPRLSVSTAFAAELISEGCDVPRPSPERTGRRTRAPATRSPHRAKQAIETTTSAQPNTLARRSPADGDVAGHGDDTLKLSGRQIIASDVAATVKPKIRSISSGVTMKPPM